MALLVLKIILVKERYYLKHLDKNKLYYSDEYNLYTKYEQMRKNINQKLKLIQKPRLISKIITNSAR